MRRFLVVGCGGSGGATLTYMMDQLRAELAAAGVERIPAGWQFVHIDVPTSPESVPGLGTVLTLGGTYVSTAPTSGSYKVLDNALTGRLGAQSADNGDLSTIATWAPRDPESVRVPLTEGAGQYRGLGRVITLSKAAVVRDALQRAWDKLYSVSTDSEMKTLSLPGAGPYYSNDKPVVLVVSSMAGGAGASMALDVCRLLTMVSGVDPQLMGVFMVAPDIFDRLDPDARTGVRANALAMLGEIVASQTGAAREHDVTLLRALGLDHGEGELIPFARVFPVGRFVGADRTVFGDGTPGAVYRGLGRGLSALILSGKATHDFVAWDLTNGGGETGNRHFVGWGNQGWDNLPWGAFGFASLSMGRDRYAEYAAQRLARSSVDRLLRAHQQPGKTTSDEEQINAILDEQWPQITRQLGLPDLTGSAATSVGEWIGEVVLPPDQVAQLAANVVNSFVRPYMPSNSGVAAAQWVSRVRQVLAERARQSREGAQTAAYAVGFQWQQHFVARLEEVTTQAMATLGMPYATGLVKRVQRTLADGLLPAGQDLARYPVADLAELPADSESLLGSRKGTLPNPSAILEKVLGGTQGTVEMHIYALLAEQIARASGALVSEVFEPLVDALDESQKILRQAAAGSAQELGLAHLSTDEYAAWPAEQDETVAARFAEADNEVMLTSSAEFKQRYEIDLPQSVGVVSGDRRGMEEGLARASGHVITGAWETVTGLKAPAEERPLIERTSDWRSKAFPRHPDGLEMGIAQPARYDIHVRPAELLDRARKFVARPDSAFEQFCSVSLREFLTDAPESELAQRQQLLITKFGEALQLARPLASVNEKAMQALHGADKQMVYRYKFSAIPFRGKDVAEALVSSLAVVPNIHPKTADALESALTDEGKIKRIDIFGSYPNYLPLAYTSVVEPAATQWNAASPSQRKSFWTLRRARPLTASLPMHPSERRVLVAGWLLGRAVGFIQQPTEPYTLPAYVWDTESQRWLAFPHPLLTPPSEFKASYDWLPAILESFLIAIAQSHQPPVMASLEPYRALRRIYDDSAEDPVSGLHTLAAKRHLTRWLRTGNLGTGAPSVIAGAGEHVAVDDRAQLLQSYLREFRDFAGRHYMAPGESGGSGQPGAPGGGTFSVIAVRPQASQTPLFRDIAADVFWATGELLDLIPECANNAKQPEVPDHTTTPPAAPGAQEFAIPQFGQTYEVPRGENF